MTDEIVKTLLKGLKQDKVRANAGNSIDVYNLEVEILFYICRGDTDLGIANKIGSSKSRSSVFNLRKELGRRFGNIKPKGYTLDEVCPIFMAMVPIVNGRPQFEPWPPSEPEPQPTLVVPPPDPDPVPPDPPPLGGRIIDQPPAEDIPPPGIVPTEQRIRREGCLSLPVLLGALLLVVTGLLIWSVLTDESQPVERIVEVTRLIEIEREVTVPPVEVTRLVEIINTVEVPIRETVLAIQTVPPVEVTKIVEVTPVPPTPTSIPQTVTITEDFDDLELDPVFTVVGDPQFANGRFNAVNPVTISIGDDTWENYSITFDCENINNGYSLEVTVRDKGTSKLRYAFEQWWYLGSDGRYVGLVGTDISWIPRVEISVEGGRVVHVSPQTAVTIANTYSDSGKITITFKDAWIDNLVITRND